MSKTHLKSLGLLSLFVFSLLFVSRNKEETVTDDVIVENFVAESVYAMQRDGNCGKFGCFEFVFPITINFPDGSSASVDDYDVLKETIRTWKEANPDAEGKPTLGFPLEVLTQDGDVLSVANREELGELRKECRRDYYQNNDHRRHKGKGNRCFKLTFPVTIAFPDATTAEAADRQELKLLLREWKSNNPGPQTERPELTFPITVELEDGSTQTVNSREELQDLKETCSQE